MNVLTFSKSISFGTLLSISTLISAGDKVDRTLDASADGRVEIHNVRGEIKVIGWDENQVKVSGELDDLVTDFIFKSQGNVTVIDIKMPRRNINRGSGTNLVIKVPINNRVDINVISTDITLENIKGGVDAQTISGELVASNVHNRLFLETVSGNVYLKDGSGRLKIESVSGDIDGVSDSKEVMASTVSGDVKLKLSNFDSLSAESVSGDIWVSGQLNDSGKLRLATVNGDVTLAFDAKVNARVRAGAGPGGDITNNLSSDKVEDVFPSQQKLRMSLGDGSGIIKIGTVNGSIILRGSN